ncbi:MAG: ATP-binding protein [Caulobacter sp.]|nr:ATP-binding protein [Caulobacter sp.]
MQADVRVTVMDEPAAAGLAEDSDGLLPVLSAPDVMLSGLISPLPMLWALTLPFGILLALLGHPWIGLCTTLANMGGDWVAQTIYRRWQAAPQTSEAGVDIRKISNVACMRAAVAMTGGVAPVLYAPAAPELVFTGLMACLLLVVAVAQGSMSPRLLWMSAWPVLVGVALVIIALFPPVTAVILLAVTGMLAAMLGLLAGGVGRILGDWTTMRERNNQLIERLVAERAEAEQAREEARVAGEAKASFLATMSHEIRTPMNGVLGMAQMLKRSATGGEQIQQIDTLIHSGEYLMSILNDILDISRIDAGQLEVATRSENLQVMLDDLGRLWGPSAEEKGLFLKIEIAAGLPVQLLMDARRVRQVLFNLIGNALKFTSAGGVTLTVDHASLPDGRVRLRIAVRDTGIGIEQSALPALFERFSQADQSISRQFGGAGLGLAISRQLTELMGGNLWAESRPGEGSCFFLELPLTRAAEPAVVAEHEDNVVEPAGQTPSLSILIVDDNAVNLMVLNQILNALGHQCVRANSGAEALRHAAGQPFDLILFDIRMPGMSGVEALAALRAADGPNRDTRALAVTADVLTHGHGGYLSLGFSGHVSKPIQIGALIAEIEQAMNGDDRASAVA